MIGNRRGGGIRVWMRTAIGCVERIGVGAVIGNAGSFACGLLGILPLIGCLADKARAEGNLDHATVRTDRVDQLVTEIALEARSEMARRGLERKSTRLNSRQ